MLNHAPFYFRISLYLILIYRSSPLNFSAAPHLPRLAHSIRLCCQPPQTVFLNYRIKKVDTRVQASTYSIPEKV